MAAPDTFSNTIHPLINYWIWGENNSSKNKNGSQLFFFFFLQIDWSVPRLFINYIELDALFQIYLGIYYFDVDVLFKFLKRFFFSGGVGVILALLQSICIIMAFENWWTSSMLLKHSENKNSGYLFLISQNQENLHNHIQTRSLQNESQCSMLRPSLVLQVVYNNLASN